MNDFKRQGKSIDVGEVWWFWFSTSAFDVDKRLRRLFRRLPSDPRCKFCNAPFAGPGGWLVKALFGKERSQLNPHFCNMCDVASRKFPGGAEVEMSMLFADIRGSTALSERMSPLEFSKLINRFYSLATKVITASDGVMDALAGDEVVGFWGEGFAGPDYVRRTVEVAQELARVMANAGIPVGVGVNYGVAFFGVVGTAEGLTDISAIGEEVNTAARLASQAGTGEILVSEVALQKAGLESGSLERRELELKGISQPVAVRVLRAS